MSRTDPLRPFRGKFESLVRGSGYRLQEGEMLASTLLRAIYDILSSSMVDESYAKRLRRRIERDLKRPKERRIFSTRKRRTIISKAETLESRIINGEEAKRWVEDNSRVAEQEAVVTLIDYSALIGAKVRVYKYPFDRLYIFSKVDSDGRIRVRGRPGRYELEVDTLNGGGLVTAEMVMPLCTFTFVSVCEILNLEPDTVREKIQESLRSIEEGM